MVNERDDIADGELVSSARPVAADTLRVAFGAAIRTVMETMTDSPLRTLVISELMLAHQRAAQRLN